MLTENDADGNTLDRRAHFDTMYRRMRELESEERALEHKVEQRRAALERTDADALAKRKMREHIERLADKLARARKRRYDVQASLLLASALPDERQREMDTKVRCYSFAYELAQNTRGLLHCVRRWSQFQPLLGRSRCDQYLFVLCVFAVGPACLTVSTRRGVTLFSDCSGVANFLFGEDERLDSMRHHVTPMTRVDARDRRYNGHRPNTDTFNVPFEHISKRALWHLSALMSARFLDRNGRVQRTPFGGPRIDVTSGDVTLTEYRFDRYLSDALAPLRAKLMRLYCADMIVSCGVKLDASSLASVLSDALHALDQAHTHCHIWAAQNGAALDHRVNDTLLQAHRALRNGQLHARLLWALRRHACRRACDYVTRRYLDEPLEDVLAVMSGESFI